MPACQAARVGFRHGMRHHRLSAVGRMGPMRRADRLFQIIQILRRSTS